jgi:HNH endonuclease
MTGPDATPSASAGARPSAGAAARWDCPPAAPAPPHAAPRTWERVRRRIAVTPGCWWWTGAVADDGYGRVSVGDVTWRVSRWVWTAWRGPIPPGLVVMHRVCDEPLCARLDHLAVGTQQENLATMGRRGRGAGPHHWGRGDRRGLAARSRAIRDAILAHGPGSPELAAAIAAGDPLRDQLALWP